MRPRPHFTVLTFPGSNCDRDCVHVLREVLGLPVRLCWHADFEASATDAVVLPGGFSYGDYLRPGAIASVSPALEKLRAFAAGGGLVIGICNGFQILCEAGLLPGALLTNDTARFRCRFTEVRVERTDTPFTCALSPGETLRLPIAHREGRYVLPPERLEALERERSVLLRYAGENPNGSIAAIAGVCNAEGNVFGLMPHPERAAESRLGSRDGRAIFASMVQWLDRRRETAS